ncbi:MAG: hypothetical protein LC799_14885, partial [Actinobacteria bacterium]|nr:hypothetical protein [Actinomycetota bacterium]
NDRFRDGSDYGHGHLPGHPGQLPRSLPFGLQCRDQRFEPAEGSDRGELRRVGDRAVRQPGMLLSR